MVKNPNDPAKPRLTAEEIQVEIKNRESWARIVLMGAGALAGLALAGVLIWKMLNTPDLLAKLDFSDVLSLVLALFSIWLSVSFYYKATEQSNAFYDRVFAFTKDVGVTLGRIEERFGERLQGLQENYSGVQRQFESALPALQAARADEAAIQGIFDEQFQSLQSQIQQFGEQHAADKAEVAEFAAQIKAQAATLERVRGELASARSLVKDAEAELQNSDFLPELRISTSLFQGLRAAVHNSLVGRHEFARAENVKHVVQCIIRLQGALKTQLVNEGVLSPGAGAFSPSGFTLILEMVKDWEQRSGPDIGDPGHRY